MDLVGGESANILSILGGGGGLLLLQRLLPEIPGSTQKCSHPTGTKNQSTSKNLRF